MANKPLAINPPRAKGIPRDLQQEMIRQAEVVIPPAAQLAQVFYE